MVDRIDEDFDEIDDDNQYYKVLLGDIEQESNTSLYATTPENPNEMLPDDDLAGESAIQNLHSKFKKYKRIKEIEQLEKKEPMYPLVEFLDATDNKGILPKTLGLIKTKPIEISKYPSNTVKTIFVGKDYAEPLAEGIKVINKIKELDLSNSDLSYDKLKPILKRLPKSLETLKIP